MSIKIIKLNLKRDLNFHKITLLSLLHMKTAIHSKIPAAGFSLLEMLMTVAILGIMTSIGLAWFGGDGSQVRQARDQRNAQNICTLCQAVEAAGLNLADEAETGLDIARRLSQGITIEKGALKGRTFQVPGLGQEELEGAARFLNIQNGQIRYDVTGKAKDGETNA